jgi:hypothetical protein
MEENPSCDAIGFSASQEIPCLSRSLKFHYHVHKINLVVKFVNIKYFLSILIQYLIQSDSKGVQPDDSININLFKLKMTITPYGYRRH